jgi:hypothetical protein
MDPNLVINVRGTKFLLPQEELLQLPETFLLFLIDSKAIVRDKIYAEDGETFVDCNPEMFIYMIAKWRAFIALTQGYLAFRRELPSTRPQDLKPTLAPLLLLKEELDCFFFPLSSTLASKSTVSLLSDNIRYSTSLSSLGSKEITATKEALLTLLSKQRCIIECHCQRQPTRYSMHEDSAVELVECKHAAASSCASPFLPSAPYLGNLELQSTLVNDFGFNPSAKWDHREQELSKSSITSVTIQQPKQNRRATKVKKDATWNEAVSDSTVDMDGVEDDVGDELLSDQLPSEETLQNADKKFRRVFWQQVVWGSKDDNEDTDQDGTQDSLLKWKVWIRRIFHAELIWY